MSVGAEKRAEIGTRASRARTPLGSGCRRRKPGFSRWTWTPRLCNLEKLLPWTQCPATIGPVGEAVHIGGEIRIARAEARAARLERAFELPMFVAALLVVPVVVIENSSVTGGWRTFAGALNWLIWSAFALELIVMLVAVPNRGDWLRTHPLEAAIVVLTPPFLPASLQALRLFRLLRLLRLAVVVKRYRRIFTADGVRAAAVIAGLRRSAEGHCSPPSRRDIRSGTEPGGRWRR
jgi:hypothetical protein